MTSRVGVTVGVPRSGWTCQAFETPQVMNVGDNSLSPLPPDSKGDPKGYFPLNCSTQRTPTAITSLNMVYSLAWSISLVSHNDHLFHKLVKLIFSLAIAAIGQ